MNKKLNTVIFMLVATIISLVIMLAFLLIPLIPYFIFIAPYVDSLLTQIVLLVIALGSMVGTYAVYNAILKKFMQKVDMDKYFHPIFNKKQNKRY